jgi:CheY-like chemotaxis protein
MMVKHEPKNNSKNTLNILLLTEDAKLQNELLDTLKTCVVKNDRYALNYCSKHTNPDIIIFDLCETKKNNPNQKLIIEQLLAETQLYLPYFLFLAAEESIEFFFLDQFDINLVAKLFSENIMYCQVPIYLEDISAKISSLCERAFHHRHHGEITNPFNKLKTIINILEKGLDNSVYDKRKPADNGDLINFRIALSEFKGNIAKKEEYALFKNLGEYLNNRLSEKALIQHKKYAKPSWLIKDIIIAYFKNAKNSDEQFHVLLIENNPDSLIPGWGKMKYRDFFDNVFPKLFPNFHYWICEKEYNHLERYLAGCLEGSVKRTNGPPQIVKLGGHTIKEDFEYDLILVDMYLGDKDNNGIKLLNLLSIAYPEIPSFMVSALDDHETVREAIKNGADYFIPKSQTISIPFSYYCYMDSIGPIISKIGEKYIRRNLARNIRYWKYKKDLLWFGDKCYHMIEHAYNHINGDWELANAILTSGIVQDKWEKLKIDKWYYSLSMAIWLHDIGHKGNARYGEPYQIRDNHGLISAELILNNYALFNIIEVKNKDSSNNGEFDDYYRNLCFPLGPAKCTLPQLIRDRKRSEGLTTLETIALIAAYHKSNAPLTSDDGLKMLANGKDIPVDYFENLNPYGGELITLEHILDKRLDQTDCSINDLSKDDILGMQALFRFIDGLDIRSVRVGDEKERKLKKLVIDQDKNYYMCKLKSEVQILSERFAKGDRALALEMYEQLYRKAQEGLDKQTFKLDPSFRNIVESVLGNLDEYWMLLNHANFISVQGGHFDLHSCIDKIQILNNKGILEIRYIANKCMSWLSSHKIREMRKDEITILERLFGNGNLKSYALEELAANGRYLMDLLKLKKGIIITLQVPVSESGDDIRKIEATYGITEQMIAKNVVDGFRLYQKHETLT